MNVKGKVEFVNEKFGGVKIDNKWYNADGKAKDFLPQKGDEVELTISKGNKFSFCKVMSLAATKSTSEFSKEVKESMQEKPEIRLRSNSLLIEDSRQLADAICAGVGTYTAGQLTDVRLKVFEILALDRRTCMINLLNKGYDIKKLESLAE